MFSNKANGSNFFNSSNFINSFYVVERGRSTSYYISLKLRILCGSAPYLLSPSLGNNVKINITKKHRGINNNNNNNQYPDFEESCKRRTRIVKFGITLSSTNRIKGVKKILTFKKIRRKNANKYEKNIYQPLVQQKPPIVRTGCSALQSGIIAVSSSDCIYHSHSYFFLLTT